MTHFLVINARAKTRGVPIHMNASLHDRWIENGANEPMRYAWACRTGTIPERGQPMSFPNALWLISKDRLYDFDLREAHGGILASDRFLDLLDEATRSRFKVARVFAVNSRGESISTRNLFYIKQKDVLHGVDRAASAFVQSNLGGTLIHERSGLPAIGFVKHLELHRDAVEGRALFELQDLIGNCIFVAQGLRDEMLKRGLKGVDLIALDRYAEAEERKIKDLERNYGCPFEEITVIGPA